MKFSLLLIFLALALLISACKKEDSWVGTNPWLKGQRFVLNNNIRLIDIKRNDSIPTEPFTVDVAIKSQLDTKGAFYFYLCHSANDMIYRMPSNNCKPVN